jgi:hypothetical protein
MKSFASRILFLMFAIDLYVSPCALALVDQMEVNQWQQRQLRSPDRSWEVDSLPPQEQDENARLVLRKTDGHYSKTLGEFFRSGLVIWSNNSKLLLFLDEEVEDTRLLVFDITAQYGFQPDDIDRAIRDSVDSLVGETNEILFYNIDPPSIEDHRLLVHVRIRTVKKRAESSPATDWEGRYTVFIKPLKIVEEHFARSD